MDRLKTSGKPQSMICVWACLISVPEHSISPRLWVGLGDGKIKVYNASQWLLESEFVQTKQSVVSCLPYTEKSDKRIHCIIHDSQQAQLNVWVDYGAHVSDTDTCIDGSMKRREIIWNDSFHHCTGEKSDHLAGPKLC